MIPILPLTGPKLSLIPLKSTDFEVLFAAASDLKIWEQHPEPNRYQREVFQKYFASAIESHGAFLIQDQTTKEIIGSSRFYDHSPEKKEIHIGYTFLKCSHWGGSTNRELKSLMLEHAFEYVERVKFEVGENNLRSQKALQKIGAILAGDIVVPGLSGDAQKHLVFEIQKSNYLIC